MKATHLNVAFVCLTIAASISGCQQNSNGDSDVSAGMHLYSQRRHAEAIPHLKNALTKPLVDYTKSEVLSMIGNCYNELGQFEQSHAYHDQALEEDPNNYRAYVNKGVVYRLQGNYEHATQMYTIALELEPDYAELHASMGALEIVKGDFEAAIGHLEHAIEIDDSIAVTHSNLAIAYANLGRFEEANAELAEAVFRGYHQPEVIRAQIEEIRQQISSELTQ